MDVDCDIRELNTKKTSVNEYPFGRQAIVTVIARPPRFPHDGMHTSYVAVLLSSDRMYWYVAEEESPSVVLCSVVIMCYLAMMGFFFFFLQTINFFLYGRGIIKVYITTWFCF